MVTKSKYGVFIIESLDRVKENKEPREGQILEQVLDYWGIPVKYRYIRTGHELHEMMKEFRRSKLRYLHLSCHGSLHNLHFRFEDFDFYDFAKIIGPFVNDKRLFLSACEATNEALASELFTHTNLLSLTGPQDAIHFPKALAFWSSFYYLMQQKNPAAMKLAEIDGILKETTKQYKQPITHFSRINNIGRGPFKTRHYNVEDHSED